MVVTEIKSSAPGRVCLFGEHQDYLNLPVIPCAINLRVNIEGNVQDNQNVNLSLPDINQEEVFNFNDELVYNKERDYYKSVVNVLKKNDFTFSNGIKGIVNGNIPINSGTSSSSALIVAWISFLAKISDQQITLPPEDIADLAFQAEVAEFNEPGGKMDHYSCALGGMIYLEFDPELNVKRFKNRLKTIVLGDSCEPKDTKEILFRVKTGVLTIIEKIKTVYPDFSIRTNCMNDISKFESILNDKQIALLNATINNYKITLKAKEILQQDNIDHLAVGKLLTEHHNILNNNLNISTPKIERMINASLEAGAFGAKINGSGGGGCMFAYAPEDPEKVAEAIEREGGKAYIVEPGNGVQ